MKWNHPEVYRIYAKLRYSGLREDELRRKHQDAYKLYLYIKLLDVLDHLESTGSITIYNDYDNENIFIKKNYIKQSYETFEE